MDTVSTVARYLLGALFTIFGLNGFFQFIPPPEMAAEGGQFMGLLATSGYIAVVKALETISGLLLLVKRKVPLALLLLGPVLVNIVLFHAFLDQANIAIGLIATVLYILTLLPYQDRFKVFLED